VWIIPAVGGTFRADLHLTGDTHAIHDMTALTDPTDDAWETRREGTLTTERAESSHGLPVVVLDGTAHGPTDLGPHLLEVHAAETARSVRQRARRAGYTVSPAVGAGVGA